MLAFITVGSTQFDLLISSIFTEKVLSAFLRKGYSHLVVQCGNSTFEMADAVRNGETVVLSRSGVEIEVWKFKNGLAEEYDRADLVIAHAGSGTILEVLRKGKSMIVVPNETLLDNHQEELASALEEMGHLKTATVANLPKVIEEFDQSRIIPFPPLDGSRFARIVDEAMGFV